MLYLSVNFHGQCVLITEFKWTHISPKLIEELFQAQKTLKRSLLREKEVYPSCNCTAPNSIFWWAEAVISANITMLSKTMTCLCCWEPSLKGFQTNEKCQNALLLPATSMSLLTVISNATHRYTLLSPQTLKLILKHVTVSNPKGASPETGWEEETQRDREESFCARQLICNAARVFGVCMSNASALHRNTITRAVHRGNAKWDIRAQHWAI